MDFLSLFNYIDAVIIIIALITIMRGVRDGVVRVALRLVGFLGGLGLAFWGYQYTTGPIATYLQIGPPLSYVLGFLAIFIAVQIFANILIGFVVDSLPEEFQFSTLSRLLAIVPAGADAAIFISLILLTVLVLPVPQPVKNDISSSYLGEHIVEQFSDTERYLNQTFGDAIEEALARLMIHPKSNESVSIPFRPSTLQVAPETEQEMLALVNEERKRAGVGALVFDEEIAVVARAHSEDMWERGYFSHINPDNMTPFDRMSEGGIEFGLAGENLALAPTLGIAHRGLMNSPGHRANILEPGYKRVGIGIIVGGRYGLMVTQNFAD